MFFVRQTRQIRQMSARRPGIFPHVKVSHSGKASHIFKHQQYSEHCRALCLVDCFHTLDHASMSFQLNIKEAIHIQREQPSLNQQLHLVNLKLSFLVLTLSRFTYIPLLLV